MTFEVGDTVMHWNHGLGQILGKEERTMTGERKLYYVVKMHDLNIWVPADDLLAGRLRAPTSAPAFKKLFAILSGPAQSLPGDRRERKTQLHTSMAGGKAEAFCRVIRDLTTLGQNKPLNFDDKSTLKRACEMLLGEWQYALQIPPAQAQNSLQELLLSKAGS